MQLLVAIIVIGMVAWFFFGRQSEQNVKSPTRWGILGLLGTWLFSKLDDSDEVVLVCRVCRKPMSNADNFCSSCGAKNA